MEPISPILKGALLALVILVCIVGAVDPWIERITQSRIGILWGIPCNNNQGNDVTLQDNSSSKLLVLQ
jgi:hypothetical protein